MTTIDNVKTAATSAFYDALGNIDKIEVNDYTLALDAVRAAIEAVTEDVYCDYSVCYYHEAWEIVGSSDFEPDEELDFSDCTSALECVMREANASVEAPWREAFNEARSSTEETLGELGDLAEAMGITTYSITVSNGSLFGWAIPNKETEEGICIYDDSKGGFNPKKIEGELYAVEVDLGAGIYASICWNPDTIIEE